jgi:predicted helicase
MTTTIQIDDNIKKQLFKIKLKLEEQKGSAVTYNEIIDFLIRHQKTNIIKKKNMEEFRRFEGILPASALDEYLEEKKKELEREELRAPLKKDIN